MDSLTQLTLGAAVAVAIAGRTVGPRKAAVIGGVLGTLPDLDVLMPLGDPVSDFIYHRGPSHSLFVQALATPLIGEVLRWFVRDLRPHRWLVYALVYLCLSTHALLDAMTVYGTRIFWPLPPDPFGVGSLFIIDPAYTLPLLILFISALFLRRWSKPFAMLTAAALVMSTAYAGWSVVAQTMALERARDHLAGLGVEPARLMATPTPFNTLFWRAIATDGDRYLNVYVSLPSGEVQAYDHDRGEIDVGCLPSLPHARNLEDFAQGFIKTETVDGRLVVSDLRMGITPAYVFSFAVAERQGEAWRNIEPVQIRSDYERSENDWAWLWGGIRGETITRLTERSGEGDGPLLAAANVGEAGCQDEERGRG